MIVFLYLQQRLISYNTQVVSIIIVLQRAFQHSKYWLIFSRRKYFNKLLVLGMP